MKKQIATCLFSCIILVSQWYTANAQVDPHFSQYYIYPMGLNPALTGAIEKSYRISSIYRNQWSAVSNPYSTIGFSADVSTEKKINFGANIFRQTAGDAANNYTTGHVSLAYTGIRFGQYGEQEIALGVQGGILSRQLNPSKLRFGNQWLPGQGYEGTISPNEAFAQSSAAVFDAGVGIAYYDNTPDKKVSFFGGFSAFHITRPIDPYLESGTKEKLPVKYSTHIGSRIVINDGLMLVPNAIYLRQGNASETMAGAYLQLYANEDTDLMLGSNIRLKDAVVPFIGIYFRGFTAGFSYDVNTSSLSKSVKNTNSFEISISFTGGNKDSNSRFFKCPRF